MVISNNFSLFRKMPWTSYIFDVFFEEIGTKFRVVVNFHADDSLHSINVSHQLTNKKFRNTAYCTRVGNIFRRTCTRS